MTAFEIVDVEFSNLFPSVIVDEFIQKPVTIEKVERLVLTHIHKKVRGKIKRPLAGSLKHPMKPIAFTTNCS